MNSFLIGGLLVLATIVGTVLILYAEDDFDVHKRLHDKLQAAADAWVDEHHTPARGTMAECHVIPAENRHVEIIVLDIYLSGVSNQHSYFVPVDDLI